LTHLCIKVFAGESQRAGLIGVGVVVWVLGFVLMGDRPQRVDAQSPPAPLSCSIGQITNTITGDGRSPSINADGTRIAFVSDADLTGENPDGNREIFLFDTTTATFTQITDTTEFRAGLPLSFSPSINADGTRIAFVSSADLTGGNPDGNREIFLFDTTTTTFTQITDTTPGRSFSPSINADGTRIAFHSSADLTGGEPRPQL